MVLTTPFWKSVDEDYGRGLTLSRGVKKHAEEYGSFLSSPTHTLGAFLVAIMANTPFFWYRKFVCSCFYAMAWFYPPNSSWVSYMGKNRKKVLGKTNIYHDKLSACRHATLSFHFLLLFLSYPSLAPLGTSVSGTARITVPSSL